MAGDHVQVSWAEGKSDYACPKVFLSGLPDNPDDYIAYRVKRLILREQGRPVSPYDTESNYCTRCGYERRELNNVAAGDPNSIRVASAGDSRWTVTAGTVTFTLRAENGEPCVVSAG